MNHGSLAKDVSRSHCWQVADCSLHTEIRWVRVPRRRLVDDYYIQKRRGWLRLHEKGGKVNQIPCHHNLEQFLDEWLAASGLAKQPSAPLFPTMRHGKLAGTAPLPQSNVHMMIRRRAIAAGIGTKISAHSFRATGITTYLQNGGKLEVAQQMAGHESARTTGLYDLRNDSVALDEVERVVY
jgi:integrase